MRWQCAASLDASGSRGHKLTFPDFRSTLSQKDQSAGDRETKIVRGLPITNTKTVCIGKYSCCYTISLVYIQELGTSNIIEANNPLAAL